MIKEGINFEGIKKLLIARLEKVKPLVEIENKRAEKIEPAKVSANCPEMYKELAERLVAIQNEYGAIKRKYIEKFDKYKLVNLATKYNISFKDVVSSLVENAYYDEDNVIYARNISKLLSEFDEIYKEINSQNVVIPFNAFSKETQAFIKNMKIGISKEEITKIILNSYGRDPNVEIVQSISNNTIDEKHIKQLKNEWIELKPIYERERQRALETKPAVAEVSSNCPEKLKPLAERLVAIQNEKGGIKREYIEKVDYDKLCSISNAGHKLQVQEAVSLMINNAYYVDDKVLKARKFLRVITEVEELYQKYYEENKAIPLNELSYDTLQFIFNLRTGLPKEDVVRLILSVYRDEYADVNIVKNISKKPLEENGDFKVMLTSLMPLVDRERQRALEGNSAIAGVSENCPERLKPIAERLVIIQNEKGELKKQYIEKSDYQKLSDMSKTRYRLTVAEAINFIVDNAYYVDDKVINARYILRFLEEFHEIYEKFYGQYNAIPLNEFSDKVNNAIKVFNRGQNVLLSREDIVRDILEVYDKDLANIEMWECGYRHLLTSEEISQITSDLKEISAENGSLNVIFAQEYEDYFKGLCERLTNAGYDFEKFVKEFLDLSYTRCYKCNDVVKVVKKMCESYKQKYNTTVGIYDRDRYLSGKLDHAKEVLGEYTIKGVLEKMGISSDNNDTSDMVISEEELNLREITVFKKLEKIYLDKHILVKSITNDREIYKELLFLAKRRRFDNVNDYLESRGYLRDSWNGGGSSIMFLSDRDIVNYGFLEGCKTDEDIEKMFASYGIEFADPYENLGNYRKLAYEGIDSCAKKNSTNQTDKEMY